MVDVKRILEKTEKAGKKAKTSFFLTADLYETFKTICENEDRPVSRVLEELIKEFVEGYKTSKKK